MRMIPDPINPPQIEGSITTDHYITVTYGEFRKVVLNLKPDLILHGYLSDENNKSVYVPPGCESQPKCFFYVINNGWAFITDDLGYNDYNKFCEGIDAAADGGFKEIQEYFAALKLGLKIYTEYQKHLKEEKEKRVMI